ncbi:LysM peptidoglycan-binding domain-containing protein [Sporosarcina soli]|uniref:LysM peptidoglycan-binding domain-containing protein n=1 Tax=Sporosarcina soli TaxID=334736 RepID=A0ABW0THP2_9BACL
MKKDDYKTEFEEHRKEISLDDSHDAGNLPSRAELHRKGRKPKKKSGHLLINVILGLFTLIPVLILVYFLSDFYLPEDSTKAKVEKENSGSIYEINNKNDNEKSDAASVKKEDEASKESNKDTDKDTNKVDTGTVAKQDQGKTTAPKVEEKSEEKAEKKPVVNVNPTPEKKQEVETEQKTSAKTHIVANGENLYRIALKHYGSGSEADIEKIRRANGLASNEIRVGQKLSIP